MINIKKDWVLVLKVLKSEGFMKSVKSEDLYKDLHRKSKDYI